MGAKLPYPRVSNARAIDSMKSCVALLTHPSDAADLSETYGHQLPNAACWLSYATEQ